MNILTEPRAGNLAGFAVCAAMMSFALYAQYGLGMEPCPLCVLQRVATITLGLLFLVAAAHNAGRTGRVVYAGLLPGVALAGLGVAGRHVWLQNLPPDQVPACGPGLDFMLDTFPLSEVLSIVLSGSGECAEVAWRFLGLTIPAWTLLAFAALGAWGVRVNWTFRRN